MIMNEINKKQDFDTFADTYRTIHTNNVKGISGADSDYFSEYKILEIKDDLEGEKILDFGCGDGNSAKFINNNIKKYEYHGIDVSEKSIEQAKLKNIPKASFYHYDGYHIPFENETFDVAFCSCVFHHIDSENHISMLKEIYRVLKHGSKLFIFEHNPLNPLTLKAVHDCPFDVGVKLINSAKMISNLRNANFFINKKMVRFTLFFPRKSIFKKFLHLEKKLWWFCLGAQYYCIGIKE